MKSSPWHLLVLCASCTTQIAVATTIATFTDDNCQHPLQQLKGQNGYPSGNCTELGEAGQYGSFKVIEEDPGCAVTIYKNGKETCPLLGREPAPLQACFGSSWIYFSIDNCQGQPSSTTSLSTTGVTTTGGTATGGTATGGTATGGTATGGTATGGTATGGTTTQETTTSPGTPATTTAKTAPSSNDNNHVGAIAGGVVGGVVGISLVLGVLWFLWRRRHPRHKGRRAELPSSESNHALGLKMSELEAPKAVYEVPITESSPSELPESKALPSELPETKDRPIYHP